MSDNEPVWRKGTRSTNGGNCVEVAAGLAAGTGVVLVRDSKNPSGPVLTVPAVGWAAFVAAARGGHFDR
ncbi:MAG TPA: DUF397 domain-containing protein [Actinoplanes sp.]